MENMHMYHQQVNQVLMAKIDEFVEQLPPTLREEYNERANRDATKNVQLDKEGNKGNQQKRDAEEMEGEQDGTSGPPPRFGGRAPGDFKDHRGGFRGRGGSAGRGGQWRGKSNHK